MMALTVQQPFAWAIVHGGKTVENRTGFARWKHLAGQTVAIHAGSGWSFRGQTSGLMWDTLATYGWTAGPLAARAHGLFRFGAVIGLVHVTAVHEALADCCQPWGQVHGYSGRADVVHLVLTDRRQVAEPITCRGQLGPWRLPAAMATQLQPAVA